VYESWSHVIPRLPVQVVTARLTRNARPKAMLMEVGAKQVPLLHCGGRMAAKNHLLVSWATRKELEIQNWGWGRGGAARLPWPKEISRNKCVAFYPGILVDFLVLFVLWFPAASPDWGTDHSRLRLMRFRFLDHHSSPIASLEDCPLRKELTSNGVRIDVQDWIEVW